MLPCCSVPLRKGCVSGPFPRPKSGRWEDNIKTLGLFGIPRAEEQVPCSPGRVWGRGGATAAQHENRKHSTLMSDVEAEESPARGPASPLTGWHGAQPGATQTWWQWARINSADGVREDENCSLMLWCYAWLHNVNAKSRRKQEGEKKEHIYWVYLAWIATTWEILLERSLVAGN